MKEVTFNKAVNFNYQTIETFEVGVKLLGSEVKSIRNGHISIKESFIAIENNELVLKQCFIKKFEQANTFSQIDEVRRRVLLIKRKQIDRLKKEVEQKGLTIVPRKVYINDKGLIKLEIILAKGKSNIDKRHSLKEKDLKLDIQRSLKDY